MLEGGEDLLPVISVDALAARAGRVSSIGDDRIAVFLVVTKLGCEPGAARVRCLPGCRDALRSGRGVGECGQLGIEFLRASRRLKRCL